MRVVNAKLVSAKEGYQIWASSYDLAQNPVVTLERRILAQRLGDLTGRRILDIATGTGFWLDYAVARGAKAFGVDISRDMLREASRKPRARGRLVQGDISRLPFAARVADIALCSFAAGYLSSVSLLIQEMARVARAVVVTDLHERAVQSGWQRGFKQDGEHYAIDSFSHDTSDLDDAACGAGLQRHWRVAASFDEPERAIFEQAGKAALFDELRTVPAILCTYWRHS